jgi:DNA-binding CsgD family transcriptional regulator
MTTAQVPTRYRAAEGRLAAVCADATSTRELLEEVDAILRSTLRAEGSFLCTTDPVSGVFNAEAVVTDLPDAMRAPWMMNEFLQDDHNKFGELRAAGVVVASLDDAVRSSGRPSLRATEVNARFGYGPELRAVFTRGDGCWGAVNLLRRAGAPEFDADERAWLGEIVEPVAEGLRRLVLERTLLGPDRVDPGIIMLDARGHIVSQSATAPGLVDDLWIAPLDGGPDEALPCQAVSVALVARARALGTGTTLEPITRVQGRSGHWLSLRGTHAVADDGSLAHIVLTIEPGRPDDIMAMIAAAYGLTPREQEVFAELRAGDSIDETAARMFISPHTLRTHVRSLFAKTGCSSQGELMSRLFIHRAPA